MNRSGIPAEGAILAEGVAAPEGQPFRLSGSPYERGRAQAGGIEAGSRAAVHAATVRRAERARADGLIDAAANRYLGEQRAFHEQHDPDSLAELRGIADGFGFSEDDLFAHLHLSLLQVGKSGAAAGADGCSAFAVAESGEGPLLVKNRDISGAEIGVPCVTSHVGPDVVTGKMICVGSLGNPAAYSSGINGSGFALADTHVPATEPSIGWLRYFLMTRLLARCTSVAAALDMIRSAPHAGGGTLVLADASGAVAAVEFDHGTASVAGGSLVWRTNHFVSIPVIDNAADDDAIQRSSHGRHAALDHILPSRYWTIAEAARLMSGHAPSGSGRASLCQHLEPNGSRTLSCDIYACNAGTLTHSDGNPCLGRWSTYRVRSEPGC